MVADYFILDEDLNVSDGIVSGYSEEDLEKLSEKIKRIENGDSEIISLPRSGAQKADEDNKLVSQFIDSFLNLNAISLEHSTLWIPEHDGTVKISLSDETPIVTKKSWWKFWG